MTTPRVAHLIYSPALGGSEMIAAEVAGRLDRARFDPLVLFMFDVPGPLPALLAARGVPSAHLRCTRFRRLLWVPLAVRALRRLRVDVLHVHHVPLWDRIERAAARAGIPVVLTEHARHSISKSPHLRQAARRAADEAGAFTVVSADLAEWFASELGIARERLTVVPNGVDTERFVPGGGDRALLRTVARRADGPVLVAVGRLAEAKDHATLLRALARLRLRGVAASLVIIGEGDQRPALERQVAELGLGDHVVLAGTRTDTERLVPGADAFVLSSQREGLPMVLLEALASGVPVVSTNVGGIGEVVTTGRDGLLVPARDADALAGALHAVLTEPALAARLRHEARRTAEERFALRNTVARYEAIYERLAVPARAAAVSG